MVLALVELLVVLVVLAVVMVVATVLVVAVDTAAGGDWEFEVQASVFCQIKKYGNFSKACS